MFLLKPTRSFSTWTYHSCKKLNILCAESFVYIFARFLSTHVTICVTFICYMAGWAQSDRVLITKRLSFNYHVWLNDAIRLYSSNSKIILQKFNYPVLIEFYIQHFSVGTFTENCSMPVYLSNLKYTQFLFCNYNMHIATNILY